MKPVRTLVVIASEHALRLLSAEGPGKGLVQIAHVTRDDVPGADVEFADRPGRGQAMPGGAHHGYSEGDSEQARERAIFARHAAETVARTWAGGEHDRIVLAAGPKMLSALRADLPDSITARAIAELPKDLARVPLADLPAHLAEVLVV